MTYALIGVVKGGLGWFYGTERPRLRLRLRAEETT
jgi:hypothetical protein